MKIEKFNINEEIVMVVLMKVIKMKWWKNNENNEKWWKIMANNGKNDMNESHYILIRNVKWKYEKLWKNVKEWMIVMKIRNERKWQ